MNAPPRPSGRLIRTLAALLLLPALAGCVPRPFSPVFMTGQRADLRALAGTWDGSYDVSNRGRSGSVHFELTATADTARGSIVMQARSPATVGLPERSDAPPADALIPHGQGLTVSFVQVEGGRVAGRVDTYTDPETRRTLWTTFEGTLTGDTIRGDFVSHLADGTVAQEGTWSVSRP